MVFRRVRVDSERRWLKFKRIFKFWLKVFVVIFIIWCLIVRWIELTVQFGSDWRANIFFTVMNTLQIGGWTALVGVFNKGINKAWVRYFIFVILFGFFITGLGFIDFNFTFNLFFFHPVFNTYSTGGYETGNFLLFNLAFFIGIVILAIPLHEKKE